MSDAQSYILLDGWAGIVRVPVRVIGETPKRYRVQLLANALLPHRRRLPAGATTLVPKYAVHPRKASA